MKTIFAPISILIIALTMVACKKEQEKPEIKNEGEPGNILLNYTKQTRPVLLEFTSTGCFGCGQWGKPTFKTLIENNTDIIPLAVHIKYGDPMITGFSTALGQNRYGSLYTPQLWVNDSNAVVLQGGGINGQQSIQRANLLLESAKTNNTPSLAATFNKKGSQIEVRYGVKYIDFEEEDVFYLSCFLTEDHIVNQQSGYASNPAQHNHVIRDAANETYGQIFSKSDLKEMTMEWNHQFNITADYKEENLYITLVLWKKTNERYEAINGLIVR